MTAYLARIALLSPLLLASCAGAPPKLVRLALPPEFRDCAPRPYLPATLNDQTAALLLLQYDDAWADCRSKLRAAWTLTQPRNR